MSEICTTCPECKSPLTIDPQSVDLSDVKCPVCDASVPIPSPIPVRHPGEHIHANPYAEDPPPQPSATVKQASKNERRLAIAVIVLSTMVFVLFSIVVFLLVTRGRHEMSALPEQDAEFLWASPKKTAESSEEKAPADSAVTPTQSDPEPQEGTRETALPITPPSPSRPEKEPKPSALAETDTEPAPEETEPVIHQVYEDAALEQRLAFMLAWKKSQEISTGGNAKALSGMPLLENATGPLQVEMEEVGGVLASNLPRSVYLSESEGGNRIDIFPILKTGPDYTRDQTLGPALTLRITDGCLRLDRNMFPDPGPAKVPSLAEVTAIIVGGKRFPTRYDSDLVKPYLALTAPEISLIGNQISVRFQPTETQKALLALNEYGKTTHKFKLSDAGKVIKIDPWSFLLEAKRYSSRFEMAQQSIDSFNDVLKKERNRIEDLRKELTELKKKPPALKSKKADWSSKIDSIADRITKMQNESAAEKSTRRKNALLRNRSGLFNMGHIYPNPTDMNMKLFENYIDGIACADEGWITLQGIDETLGGGIRNSINTNDFRLLIEKK